MHSRLFCIVVQCLFDLASVVVCANEIKSGVLSLRWIDSAELSNVGLAALQQLLTNFKSVKLLRSNVFSIK